MTNPQKSPDMSISSTTPPFDLGLGLEGSSVLVTGGAGHIGRVVVRGFLATGAYVTIVDSSVDCPFDQLDEHILYIHADITCTKQIDAAFEKAEVEYERPVEICVALASLDLSVLKTTESLADADPGEWKRVFDVNIHGTFVTCQRWLQGIRAAAAIPTEAAKLKNVSLVIMGSESGRFGVRTMAAYAAGKSAVQQGLMLSLAQDAPRLFSRARVNAVAPGFVDTARLQEERRTNGEEWYWREWNASYVVTFTRGKLRTELLQRSVGQAYPTGRCCQNDSFPCKREVWWKCAWSGRSC